MSSNEIMLVFSNLKMGLFRESGQDLQPYTHATQYKVISILLTYKYLETHEIIL